MIREYYISYIHQDNFEKLWSRLIDSKMKVWYQTLLKKSTGWYRLSNAIDRVILSRAASKPNGLNRGDRYTAVPSASSTLIYHRVTVQPHKSNARGHGYARIRIFDAYFKTLTHEHWPALGQNRETKGIVLSNIREKWQWNDDKSRFPAPRVSSIENFPPIFIFLLDTGYILSYSNLWLFVVNMQRSTFVHSKYLLKKFRVPRLMFRSNSRMKAPDNSGNNFFKRFDNCF